METKGTLSLKELAKEYREQAKALTVQIGSRTRRLNETGGDTRLRDIITHELNTLYSMRRDVIKTADRLESYYEKEALA